MNDAGPVRNKSVVKYFALGGAILAEAYMVYTVLAPHLPGDVMPLGATLKRFLVLSVFFGPFGLAAGTGVGLLVQGLLNLRRR